jgi:sporulation protein YlmC with PRC-barrel domain
MSYLSLWGKKFVSIVLVFTLSWSIGSTLEVSSRKMVNLENRLIIDFGNVSSLILDKNQPYYIDSDARIIGRGKLKVPIKLEDAQDRFHMKIDFDLVKKVQSSILLGSVTRIDKYK